MSCNDLVSLTAASLSLLMFATGGWAQTVEGQVSDPAGAVIPHALVELVNVDDNKVSGRVYTDNSGAFRLSATSATYFLHISAPGFLTHADAVTLRPGERTVRKYNLPVAPCLSCEGLAVPEVYSTNSGLPKTFSVCDILAAINFQVPDPQLLIAVGRLRTVGSELYLEGRACSNRPHAGASNWPTVLLLKQDGDVLFPLPPQILNALVARARTLAGAVAQEHSDELVAVYGVLEDRQPLLGLSCGNPGSICLDGYGSLRAPAEIRYHGRESMRSLGK